MTRDDCAPSDLPKLVGTVLAVLVGIGSSGEPAAMLPPGERWNSPGRP